MHEWNTVRRKRGNGCWNLTSEEQGEERKGRGKIMLN